MRINRMLTQSPLFKHVACQQSLLRLKATLGSFATDMLGSLCLATHQEKAFLLAYDLEVNFVKVAKFSRLAAKSPRAI
jgi:hypothetical protein